MSFDWEGSLGPFNKWKPARNRNVSTTPATDSISDPSGLRPSIQLRGRLQHSWSRGSEISSLNCSSLEKGARYVHLHSGEPTGSRALVSHLGGGEVAPPTGCWQTRGDRRQNLRHFPWSLQKCWDGRQETQRKPRNEAWHICARVRKPGRSVAPLAPRSSRRASPLRHPSRRQTARKAQGELKLPKWYILFVFFSPTAGEERKRR